MPGQCASVAVLTAVLLYVEAGECCSEVGGQGLEALSSDRCSLLAHSGRRTTGERHLPAVLRLSSF